MNKPTALIEFEAMLLGRHIHLHTPRARGLDGRLDRSAYLLLSRIHAEGPMSIGQLGAAFGLDLSTLNRQTAAMLRSGVVARIPDPDGGVARKFALTPEGERRLSAHRSANVEGLGRVMADWTPAEVAEFAALLRRFNGDIERHGGRPWPRD